MITIYENKGEWMMSYDSNFILPHSTYYVVTFFFKLDLFRPTNVKVYADCEEQAKNAVCAKITEILGPSGINIIKVTKVSMDIDDEDITRTLYEENGHMCNCIGNLDCVGKDNYIVIIGFGRKINGMRHIIKVYADGMDKAEGMVYNYCRFAHRHLGVPRILNMMKGATIHGYKNSSR